MFTRISYTQSLRRAAYHADVELCMVHGILRKQIDDDSRVEELTRAHKRLGKDRNKRRALMVRTARFLARLPFRGPPSAYLRSPRGGPHTAHEWRVVLHRRNNDFNLIQTHRQRYLDHFEHKKVEALRAAVDAFCREINVRFHRFTTIRRPQ